MDQPPVQIEGMSVSRLKNVTSGSKGYDRGWEIRWVTCALMLYIEDITENLYYHTRLKRIPTFFDSKEDGAGGE